MFVFFQNSKYFFFSNIIYAKRDHYKPLIRASQIIIQPRKDTVKKLTLFQIYLYNSKLSARLF
jgi:hypothetical protein